MKSKIVALLLAGALLLGGCRSRVLSPTVSPTNSPSPAISRAANVTATAAPKVPDLPKKLQANGAQTKLKIYDIKTKKISELPVEEYLCGVLAGEMRKDWPAEALKAQAIIARTFLIDFLSENEVSAVSKDADISTDPKESQAYDVSGIDDAIRKAVKETSGQVIVYDGKFIKAWFHSSSGGKTADAVEGLHYKDGNLPYIVSVDSDESQTPKEFTEWTNTFTTDEITAALHTMNIDVGDTIESVKIGQTGSSGRATTLTINDKEVSAPEFRLAMDPTKFRSTWLTEVKFDGKKLTVSGKGFGHGVGMSQWGAFQMASSGANAQDIIQHYFKDVQIASLWK